MKRQKESKVTKILMLILSLVFFTSTIVASSISKYVTQKQAYFGDKEHLDYTVNAVFVVRNQEELFAAINQGYTYVQLDQDIENPLIVTQKAETLNTDLILDLNGIEIQRNGYEPILNIKPGVRLTVVDTSTEQTGGLYNPVGSVFRKYLQNEPYSLTISLKILLFSMLALIFNLFLIMPLSESRAPIFSSLYSHTLSMSKLSYATRNASRLFNTHSHESPAWNDSSNSISYKYPSSKFGLHHSLS